MELEIGCYCPLTYWMAVAQSSQWKALANFPFSKVWISMVWMVYRERSIRQKNYQFDKYLEKSWEKAPF